MTGRRPDATKVYDLVTHFRTALPDTITMPQHFKANGYHTAALSKVYHVGYEDGRSWSEPHWYPNGQTVDTDPNDFKKRIVKKFAGVSKNNKGEPVSQTGLDSSDGGGDTNGHPWPPVGRVACATTL